MRGSQLSLLAIPPLVLACDRGYLDAHLHSQHAHDIETLEARAESFPPTWTKNEEVLHTAFDNTELETWSSYYTHGDHVAGRNKSMAEKTAEKWTANGVPATLAEYEVYLNYPDEQSVVWTSGNGTKLEAQLIEDKINEDETTSYPNSIPSFHGYSASGEVEAEYVYVGVGHKDDFAALKSAGVDLDGKIALAKYGGLFRGLKVKNAAANGMVGVVIFTDPGDDGPQEAKGDLPYPKGPARQPSSIQRGSVADLNAYVGDPTTPGRPSKQGVQRVTPSNIPKIPSIPISQRDALPILQALNGFGKAGKNMSRSGWVGGMNATYSTGPAPGIKLSVRNKMKDATTPIWNVIGVINGTNADETIVIGNHRDAWIIGGAADPNSGTAILEEVTKSFGALLKTGWKPRRNIVFASWDAEEYGLVGSTEWVEEYAPWLSDTAISYLNIDIAVNGGLPGADSTPELRGIAQSVMKKVIYGNQTLYDAWYKLYRFRPEDSGFGNLGAGSDYTSFLQVGVGALDFGMGQSNTDPVYHYHSNYDSFHWMKTFVDPDFKIHTTAGQYIALLAYHLADDVIIPYDLDAFGRNLGYWTRDITALTAGCCGDTSKTQQAINLTQLINAYKNFQNVAKTFQSTTSSTDFQKDADKVKDANTRLKKLLKLFVNKDGLPERPFYKNALMVPDRDTGYGSQTMPATIEALQDKNVTRAKEGNLFLIDAINKASAMLNLTSSS